MVGVFLCSCNGEISKVLNLEEIAEYIKGIEGVEFVKIHNNLCLKEGLQELSKYKEEKIVISACSSQIYGERFKRHAKATLEFVNIREQCAYPHRDNKIEANKKAKALIKAGIEKIKKSKTFVFDSEESKVKKSVLIIGNTKEGLHANLKLKNLGYTSYVVESSEIEEISGSAGNFKVLISNNGVKKTLNVGAIIVATGFEEWKPYEIKQYGYGVYKNVITQSELAEILYKDKLKDIEKVVFILCVGSRDSYHEYCSKICCTLAIKNAIEIKKTNPKASVTICYMDIRTYGKNEKYFKEARELGIRFIRGKPSSIASENGNLLIAIEDTLTQDFINIKADLGVLASAFIPAKDNRRLAKILGIELNKYGFFKRLYSKLRTVETKKLGVYVCGGATGIKDEEERIAESEAAVAKVIKMLKSLEEKKASARVNEKLCVGCEICAKVCPHNAIIMGNGKAKINELECKACGICLASCLYNAIELPFNNKEETFAYLEGLLKDTEIEKPIVNFVCYECGYSAIDMAGALGYTYPANILPVPLPCVGRLSVVEILKAIELGAEKVLITGCGEGGCHYLKGNEYAETQVKLANAILEEIGLGKKVESLYLFGYEAKRYVEKVRRMNDEQ